MNAAPIPSSDKEEQEVLRELPDPERCPMLPKSLRQLVELTGIEPVTS
jgi:hypothetical protein